MQLLLKGYVSNVCLTRAKTHRFRMTKRAIDVLGALFLIALLGLPMLVLGVAIKATSRGTILYWSDRVGRANKLFRMPKFRSMRTNTPAVASHLLQNPANYLTPIGGFLRRSSLDELPQLWSILRGDMSFIGPRPALFNQHDLIALRTDAGIDQLRPGVTGWAQVNGRDDLSIPDKVAFEREYLESRSWRMDALILAKTISSIIAPRGVSH